MQFIKIGDVDETAAYGTPPATISIRGVNYPSASFDVTEVVHPKTEFFIQEMARHISI